MKRKCGVREVFILVLCLFKPKICNTNEERDYFQAVDEMYSDERFDLEPILNNFSHKKMQDFLKLCRQFQSSSLFCSKLEVKIGHEEDIVPKTMKLLKNTTPKVYFKIGALLNLFFRTL